MKILLVGNKDDLADRRVVQKEEGEKFAKDNDLTFIEINTKEHSKVEDAFKIVASAIMQKIKEGKLPMHSQVDLLLFRTVVLKLGTYTKTKILFPGIVKKAKENVVDIGGFIWVINEGYEILI